MYPANASKATVPTVKPVAFILQSWPNKSVNQARALSATSPFLMHLDFKPFLLGF